MPTLKLQGGLGNQMFQYALAYSLSKKYHESILMDGYFLENRFIGANWTFRHFELDVFGIEKSYPLQNALLRRYFHPILFEIIKKFQYRDRYIKEQAGNFIDTFPESSYLDGWFQSYRYFEEFEPDMRKLFTVQTPINTKNKEFLDMIERSGNMTVSLHVRRGDYITLVGANKWHGVCSMGYYESAIQMMIEQLGSPEFYVFSDDIEWCKKNISFPGGIRVYYIDHNGSAGHEDMRLMYSCSHHIIANSSFSWWGAYLGRNPDKIITAPKKWLQTDSFSTTNLIPPTWILL